MTDAEVRYGLWKLIGSADSTAKRAIVRCAICGCVRTVNAEMLTTSHVACSGCSPPLNVDSHGRSFAAGLAAAEGRSARKRHQGRGDDG